jgi:hypothetical protein
MAFVPNASTKFLFAILKQCDLRHVDWDEVAKDEHLEKPVTNGHAARMRYSRLRASIQGPNRGRTVTTPKPAEGRVSKPKKTTAAKQAVTAATIAAQKSASPVVPDPPSLVMSPPVNIKQEFRASETPAPDHVHRFVTPGSEEMFPQTPHLDFDGRMQTPDIANPSLFGTALPEEAEECNHPEEFKQFSDAMGHLHHDHAPYMTYAVPWNFSSAHSNSACNSAHASHKSSLDAGCLHMAQVQAPANTVQDFSNANLLLPGYVRVKHECFD